MERIKRIQAAPQVTAADAPALSGQPVDSRTGRASEFMAWAHIASNTAEVQLESVAELIARALHPSPESELEQQACRATYLRIQAELAAELEAGRLDAHEGKMSVDALQAAVLAPRGIGLRFIKNFVTPARPTEIPPELLALPDDARVSCEENIGGWRGSGLTSAGDYRNSLLQIMARQGAGYFTVNEAAQVIANDGTSELDARRWVEELQEAHRAGVLPIRDASSRLRMRPLKARAEKQIPQEWTATQDMERGYSDLLMSTELDAWLRSSVGYGFPGVVASTAKQPQLRQEAPAGQPVQRRQAQEDTILAALRALGHDPKLLPAYPAGKTCPIKVAVRSACANMSDEVFRKAWKRLTHSKEIARPGAG